MRRETKVFLTLLALSVSGWLFLFGMSYFGGLVVQLGGVNSFCMMKTLSLGSFLLLLIWGVRVIARRIGNVWARTAALTAAVLLGGAVWLILLFFALFFDGNASYVPLHAPDGSWTVVAEEESWLLGGWGRFYRKVCPGLLQDTGVTYLADDGFRPFSDDAFRLEWEAERLVIWYQDGAGGWARREVPK